MTPAPRIEPSQGPELRTEWRFASGAVTGANHRRANRRCEDKIVKGRRGDVVALALADGAGSRARAETGAAVAARAACNELLLRFDDLAGDVGTAAGRIIARVNAALRREMRHGSIERRDLASTLAFVAVREGHYIAGNLGDGVVGIVGGGGGRVLLPPERGPYAHQTYFTTDATAVERTRVCSGPVEDVESFILMSDGAAHMLYEYRRRELAAAAVQIGGWLRQHEPRAVSGALVSLMRRVFLAETGDDCAIGLVTRVDRPPSGGPG